MSTSRSWARRWPVLAAAVVTALATARSAPAAESSGPFSLPLRIPPVYQGSDIHMTMREACVAVLPGPCTKMWTYDGVFPGPTIRRPSGRRTRVTFDNRLPAGAGSTSVHLHGGHTASRYDGQPDEYLIPPGGRGRYVYDLREDGMPERAAFQWYHDHRMEMTGRNVWMGLAGMFVVDDAVDSALPLPRGHYDVPLMVTDRSFDSQNQLDYKFSSIGSMGDTILVNGVAAPYFEVADRAYRFRILNASNFRQYTFQLGNGQEMVQIATESGLIPTPVRRTSLVLGPAERAEVVVDFRGHLGERITLSNTNGPIIDETSVPSQVMQFRVVRHASDTTRVPATLRPRTTFGQPSATRVFTLAGVPQAGALSRPDETTPPRNILWTFNGQTFDASHPLAEPKLGATEKWVFTNPTIMAHRIHIHDVDWVIVGRRGGQQVATPGDPDAALAEQGLRETFIVQSGETVEVLSRFTDHVGKYVFHCHILEHEDNAMMARFDVVP
jgi:FtsP/CotA-like multicopper oxidase with cupredoxin domain